MILGSIGIAPPTLLAGIAGGLAASCLLSLSPRCIVLFKGKLVRLEALGFDRLTVSLTLLAALVLNGGIVAFLAMKFGQMIIAAAVGALCFYVTGWLLALLIERRENILRDQLADLAIVMSSAVRANVAPALALEHAISESDYPLKALMSRVAEDYHRGVPLRNSLASVGARLSLDSLTLFTTAIGVTLERGGRLDEALDRIASSIHDQQRLENKLDALTASGRNALLMLALFPFGFAAFFYRLDPGGYDAILESNYGQVAIGIALALVCLSVRWGKAILDNVAT